MTIETENLLNISETAQVQARKVIADSKVIDCWESIGAKVNLVGSLSMGLLMTHRDIDFHIYTPKLDIAQSFRAIQKLAQNPRIKRVEYTNMLDEEDCCLEWHAWFEAQTGELWQLDMMHIVKGSFYDGYFERVASRIVEVMTPEQKLTILRLKYQTPAEIKIPGIEYYLAVIRDGVADFQELQEWRRSKRPEGIIDWCP